MEEQLPDVGLVNPPDLVLALLRSDYNCAMNLLEDRSDTLTRYALTS